MKYLALFLIVLFIFISSTTYTHAASDFTAEYFSNMNLTGTPVLTQSETQINHDWVAGSPHSSIPNDRFSARWTGTFNFTAGQYVFTSTSDDGARLSVDDNIIINQWNDQGPTTYSATIDLTEGNHSVKFEYYENTGGATAVMNWSRNTTSTTQMIRVMPLGDSITDGYDIPGGYRMELKNLVSNINLVGSQQNGPSQLTDREHEGHSGWRIDEIQANIVSWLQSQSPDMVLLMIGTNDMIGNYDVAGAPQRLSDLIDSIAQTRPQADILVASITPLNNNEWQQRVNAYNQTIPGIVQQKRDQGKKVHYVDMDTVLTYLDLPDGIHPSANGYTKMAQKWAGAISNLTNSTNPTPTPEPTQQPPTGTGAFSAQYFNNMNLSGLPVLTKNEVAINNDWGTGSPHSSVNTNGFSARWTTTQTFEPGTYEFTTISDDGVRLAVNGQTIIDKWIDQGPTTYKVTRDLTGDNTVVMQYYENGGGATAKLSWQKIIISTPTQTPTPSPTNAPTSPVSIPQDNGFKAQYFNNLTLTGNPVLERLEAQVNNNWGTGSPDLTVNNDSFSARWQGNFTLTQGNYRFTVRGDDGVRLIVNGQTVINKWIDQGPTTYTADVALQAGSYPITFEYYEKGGGALAELSWVKLVQTPSPTPTQEPVVPGGMYQAEYFNNIQLSGTPVLTRTESGVDYSWGMGSPHETVNNDNFSARWTVVEQFAAGTHRFTVTADDGVRLKVNGQTVIDKWIDQGPTTYSVDLVMSAGQYTFVMEYYERSWGATARLVSQQLSTDTTPVISNASFNINYFNNLTLAGTPVHSEVTSNIDYDWGYGSQHASINSDNFSARATKSSDYMSGTYRFSVTADDGVRLNVDGVTVIDKWIDQGPTTYTHDLTLSQGNHTIVIEYYEKAVGATLKFNEVKL